MRRIASHQMAHHNTSQPHLHNTSKPAHLVSIPCSVSMYSFSMSCLSMCTFSICIASMCSVITRTVSTCSFSMDSFSMCCTALCTFSVSCLLPTLLCMFKLLLKPPSSHICVVTAYVGYVSAMLCCCGFLYTGIDVTLHTKKTRSGHSTPVKLSMQ